MDYSEKTYYQFTKNIIQMITDFKWILMLQEIGLDSDDKTYDNLAKKEVIKMIDSLKKISIENEPNKAILKWLC